jgi:GT2 family glycosyltransferase
MTLAVLILNWNSLEATVSSVKAVETWVSLKPKIIVVDNGSTDGSDARIAQRCPEAVLIPNPLNRGYAGGNNDGIRRAMEMGCDLLLLLNSDAVVSEDCVSDLVRALEENTRLGIVGPVLEEGGTEGITLHGGGRDITRHINSRRILGKGKEERGLFEVDYVPGTVLLTKGEVVRSVGLLDERYFFSAEIADFCERARLKGFRCAVVGHARATHLLSEKFGMRRTLYPYYSLRNRFLFIRLHRRRALPLLSLWTLRGIFLVGSALLTLQWPRARALALALRDGLRGRWGDRNELFGV